MKITKTTLKYAEKRDLEILIETDGITIWNINNNDEWIASYKTGTEGLFFNACLMSQETKEELPYWIKDEKSLRRTIDFLSKEKH